MNESPEKPSQSNTSFSSVEELRDRARRHVLKGAVTSDYEGNAKEAIRVLQEALATELVCVLRYKSHYYRADGIHAQSVSQEFEEHAREEQEHAEWISERITQLGGVPDWNPEHLLKLSHSEFTGGETLVSLIREDLVAERIAIESYREMIRYFGDQDPTSRRLMEKILAKEEEHAQDLSDLLVTLDPGHKSSGPHLLK